MAKKLNITIQSCPKEVFFEFSPVSQRQGPFAQLQRIRSLNGLSTTVTSDYRIIFGILTSISYQSSQDSHHNLRLTHGGTMRA